MPAASASTASAQPRDAPPPGCGRVPRAGWSRAAARSRRSAPARPCQRSARVLARGPDHRRRSARAVAGCRARPEGARPPCACNPARASWMPDGLWPAHRSQASTIWTDGATRPLVGARPAGVHGPLHVRGLHDLGRAAGPALHVRTVSLPVLLSGAVRTLVARLVRAAAVVVSRLAHDLARHSHPLGAGWLPADLLLLPGRVLQGVLGRPAFLCGGRAANDLPRRERDAARAAERAPPLPLPRPPLPRDPRLRRLEGDVVPRLRHRRRHADPGRERGLPRRVRARLPPAAASRRGMLRPAPPPAPAQAGITGAGLLH